MAVNNVPQGSHVIITVQSGVNTSGQPVYQKRTYKSVKASAADADVYAVGHGMATLQKYAVAGISRMNEGNLINA